MRIYEGFKITRHTLTYDDKTGKETYCYAMDVELFDEFTYIAKEWESNEEFDKMFLMCQNVNQFYGCNVIKLTFLHYVKAYTRNLISMDIVYKAAFDYIGLSGTFNQMQALDGYPETRLDQLKIYIQTDGEFEENKVFQIALKVYQEIVEMVLKVELKRSEMPTKFS